MPKIMEPGQPYTGRAPGVIPINITIDKDAYQLLQEYAPIKKGYGRFISRLLYEHHTRITERQWLWEHLQTVLITEKC
jgi:hypothetical protein